MALLRYTVYVYRRLGDLRGALVANNSRSTRFFFVCCIRHCRSLKRHQCNLIFRVSDNSIIYHRSGCYESNNRRVLLNCLFVSSHAKHWQLTALVTIIIMTNRKPPQVILTLYALLVMLSGLAGDRMMPIAGQSAAIAYLRFKFFRFLDLCCFCRAAVLSTLFFRRIWKNVQPVEYDIAIRANISPR